MRHLSLPVVVWLVGASLFVAVLVDRASTPAMSQDAFVALLAQSGASGKPVDEAVRALSLSERAWGRTASRYAADPAVARDLEERLARLPR